MNTPEQTWNELVEWVGCWYEEADFDAMKIALCTAVSHYYPQEKPLWLLAIGNSGTGKTSLLIESLRGLPETHEISKVTPNCFLSAREKGGRNNSLLYRHGESQVWLFKDFTTFISMRFDARVEAAAALREIWDGRYTVESGMGDTLEWKGKVTAIAAATPEFERAWSVMSGLGERFMTLRWNSGAPLPAMGKARSQAGNEQIISDKIAEYVKALFDDRWVRETMPDDEFMNALDHMAIVVARLRTHVPREGQNQRDPTCRPEPEFPMRISLALSQVIRTHMDLFHHARPGATEAALGRRLAWDTIPPARLAILRTVPHTGETTCGAIYHQTQIPRSSLQRHMEDLEMLNVIEHQTMPPEWRSRPVRLTDAFRASLDSAGARLQAAEGSAVIPFTSKRRRASMNPDHAQNSESEY